MKKFLVLHGPNLNLLGSREPKHYGHDTLETIDAALKLRAQNHGVLLECFQSNSEATLIDRLHQAYHNKVTGIIFNPAAYTHTSIALRDALLAINIPFIEVHISNIFSREPFRQHSYFSDIAKGVLTGLGAQGYLFAFDALLKLTD